MCVCESVRLILSTLTHTLSFKSVYLLLMSWLCVRSLYKCHIILAPRHKIFFFYKHSTLDALNIVTRQMTLSLRHPIRSTSKKIIRNSQQRDSNSRPPVYETGAITTMLCRHSHTTYENIFFFLRNTLNLFVCMY